MPLPDDTILLNRYRIDGLLARGGMGVIYRAFDVNLSTPVAIKENYLQTPRAINQFKREAFILARLRHPNLPRVIDHFSFEERQYLVMDFIEGRDLWQIVQQQNRPLDEVPALQYITQVCDAVDYLHRQNPPIIHRDIKPQNIKVTPDDRAVLVDFGIAKQGTTDSATQSGAKGITPGFSSPEQYSGSGTTPASDIFSLGATLYALLTGKKPPNSISLLADSSKFQPPDKINIRLTHRTSQAIVHAMQAKSADRPVAVTVWQKELEGCLQEAKLAASTLPAPEEEEATFIAAVPSSAPPPAARPAPPPISAPVVIPPAAPPPRKKSRLPVVLLIVVIILMVGLGLVFYAFFSMGMLQLSIVQIDTPTVVIETPTPLADIQMTTQAEMKLTSQAEIDVGLTRQAEQNATPTRKAEAAQPTPQNTSTPIPSATPQSVAGDTVKTTPTPSLSTATPTATPVTTPVRAPAGPTLVPLKSGETIDRIGSKEVVDVDINLKNPLEVYALVKGEGIYKSINGGDGPWTKLNVDASSVTAFVIDPQNPATFYAPTWNAVLKSSDGGNTWEAYGNGLSTANRVVDVVTADPSDSSRVYASIGTTLVVSTDGGQTWASEGYGAGLLGGRMTSIVVDTFDSNIVYVAGLFASIYKSTDGGRNFAPLIYPDGSMGEGVFSMAGHPSEKNVYLASINAFQAGVVKTENGADLFNSTTGLIFGGADSAYSALAYAPSNGNLVYVGSGYEDNRFAKGIFHSTDGGTNWVRISNGLSINKDTGQPYYVKAMAVHPTKPRTVFAATGGGLFKTTDSTNWVLQ